MNPKNDDADSQPLLFTLRSLFIQNMHRLYSPTSLYSLPNPFFLSLVFEHFPIDGKSLLYTNTTPYNSPKRYFCFNLYLFSIKKSKNKNLCLDKITDGLFTSLPQIFKKESHKAKYTLSTLNITALYILNHIYPRSRIIITKIFSLVLLSSYDS